MSVAESMRSRVWEHCALRRSNAPAATASRDSRCNARRRPSCSVLSQSFGITGTLSSAGQPRARPSRWQPNANQRYAAQPEPRFSLTRTTGQARLTPGRQSTAYAVSIAREPRAVAHSSAPDRNASATCVTAEAPVDGTARSRTQTDLHHPEHPRRACDGPTRHVQHGQAEETGNGEDEGIVQGARDVYVGRD
ncbi:hypothetical protein EXIGLDRAFT_330217 [Exidia glandulosa HHB12029]|uniref:Uncharacterized protein n=1 Tax=Exidia glandulosa HHB12029 TaxID=1314781 RepID=A0A165CSE2_EXIGL|nr:hypothetical protein EXIGLDRAFT_330217 [Exidia glandulosa HHB12029]